MVVGSVRSRVVSTLVLFAGLAAVTPSVVTAHAAPAVLGKTMGQWSASSWQWAFAIPVGRNPLLDPDGTFCAENQRGPVWFLGRSPLQRHGRTKPHDSGRETHPVPDCECVLAADPVGRPIQYRTGLSRARAILLADDRWRPFCDARWTAGCFQPAPVDCQNTVPCVHSGVPSGQHLRALFRRS